MPPASAPGAALTATAPQGHCGQGASRTVLVDIKTGWVDNTTWLQLALYASPDCLLAETLKPLPSLDGALILRVDDQGCSPLWCSQAKLNDYGARAYAFLDQWKEMVAEKLISNREVYRLSVNGEDIVLPRVTSVLKGVLNREKLNNWRVKQAVLHTLEEMKKNSRTPDDVLDAYTNGFFDPEARSTAKKQGRGGEGQLLHKAISQTLLKQPLTVDLEIPWLQAAFGHYRLWAEQHDLQLCEGLSEKTVYNLAAGYAGTLDMIATVKEDA